MPDHASHDDTSPTNAKDMIYGLITAHLHRTWQCVALTYADVQLLEIAQLNAILESGLFPGARASIRKEAVKAHFREHFSRYSAAAEDHPRVRSILRGSVKVPFAETLETIIAVGKGEYAAGSQRKTNEDPTEKLQRTSELLAEIATARSANNTSVATVTRALDGLERDMNILRRVIIGSFANADSDRDCPGGCRASARREGELTVSEALSDGEEER